MTTFPPAFSNRRFALSYFREALKGETQTSGQEKLVHWQRATRFLLWLLFVSVRRNAVLPYLRALLLQGTARKGQHPVGQESVAEVCKAESRATHRQDGFNEAVQIMLLFLHSHSLTLQLSFPH